MNLQATFISSYTIKTRTINSINKSQQNCLLISQRDKMHRSTMSARVIEMSYQVINQLNNSMLWCHDFPIVFKQFRQRCMSREVSKAKISKIQDSYNSTLRNKWRNVLFSNKHDNMSKPGLVTDKIPHHWQANMQISKVKSLLLSNGRFFMTNHFGVNDFRKHIFNQFPWRFFTFNSNKMLKLITSKLLVIS